MKKLLCFAFFSIFSSNLTHKPMAKLDMREVEVMKEIGEKFGKKEWDLSLDPCSGDGNWGGFGHDELANFFVSCDCSYENDTVCHLERISINFQNISAALPLEFTNLTELKHLSLSNNYLRGTIPLEWAHMHLYTLSLTGNQLSGPFPTALTRMTTLIHLHIDRNGFSGSIPEEIANLKNLEILILSSNSFTGELPTALAKLTNLINMEISDNNFSGRIPNFISNWTQIKILHIEGCSFKGPFPSNISVLAQLTDMRISNLKGGASTFPSLYRSKFLRILVLRNCLIHGTIPDYVGHLTKLTTLDLSFNKLTGNLPSSFSRLRTTNYMYFTENNLSGPIPRWILSSNMNVDLSDNQFTWDASAPKLCEPTTVNVVESYSLSTNEQYNVAPCLRKDFPCTKSNAEQIYSLHINCGGEEVTVNSTVIYEGDKDRGGASSYHNGGNWAFSSTGNFLDSDSEYVLYILSNTSNLNNISSSDIELYTKARTSAISLTYYGLCLMNGNYTVKLHFAEIVFTQDDIGKRVFDVYVQGELKLKDFDIVKEAGGTGIALIKKYTVNVKKNTLKIRLYWAGKGTTDIPEMGNYGPIISAISVEPQFEIPHTKKKQSNVGLIAGTVGGGLLFVISLIFFLWRKGYILGDKSGDTELRGINLQTGVFTLKQLKAATNNFDSSNKLGEGGFGAVYKGLLSDGTMIAVKQLSSKSKQGATEFVNEITMLSTLRHPNLVRLYGCCVEGNQMSLVYEYMENNCLSRVLFGADKVSKAKLTWPVRVNICRGIARGLLYLHEESNLSIIHRDIKANNILLDENFNAKISDFGLAKLNDDEDTHIITHVAGTIGYMAPEYAMRGYLTAKADIYSFGVVILEIVSGKSNNYQKRFGENIYFLRDWAIRGNPLEVVDPDVRDEYSIKEAKELLDVALLCTILAYNDRPTIIEINQMLEGQIKAHDFRKGRVCSTSYSKDHTFGNQCWKDKSESRLTNNESYTMSFVSEPVITELS